MRWSIAGCAFDSDLLLSAGFVPLGVTRPPERAGFFAMVILLSRTEPDRVGRCGRTGQPQLAERRDGGEPRASGTVAGAGSIAHGSTVPSAGRPAAVISLQQLP